MSFSTYRGLVRRPSGSFVSGSAGEAIDTSLAALADYLLDQAVPAGVVQAFAGSSAPGGWVLCDGASLLRAGTYAGLFAAIGTAFGSADGTHFTVPDLRGRCPIGVGSGSGLTARALADSGGEETHQLNVAELAQHAHAIALDTSATGTSTGVVAAGASNLTGMDPSYEGSDTPHNNMPPYLAMNFIIKY